MQRELALPLKELSPVEAADVARIGEAVHQWQSGEQHAVPVPVTLLSYAEPIGPKPADPHEVFAADALGAPIPEVERFSPFYRSVLAGQTAWMSQVTIDSLESPTGTWTRGDIAALLAERAQ